MTEPNLWRPFNDGSSLGTLGPEGGRIMEGAHGLGARITLETGGQVAPFGITCGIYGLMVHTTWSSSEADARRTDHVMKSELGTLVQGDSPEAAQAFIERY